MKTVIETATFIKQANKVWSIEERENFVDYIAANPLVGDVIKGTNGVRKIRWRATGKGKRGGARIIYLHVDQEGLVTLLTVYVKNEKENISDREIKRLQNE